MRVWGMYHGNQIKVNDTECAESGPFMHKFCDTCAMQYKYASMCAAIHRQISCLLCRSAARRGVYAQFVCERIAIEPRRIGSYPSDLLDCHSSRTHASWSLSALHRMLSPA